MRRFLPRSLIGQIALVMAAALLVAQALNFTLIYTERQRFSRAQIEGPAISRFLNIAQRAATLPPVQRRELMPARLRRSRVWIGDESAVAAGGGDAQLVERLRAAAAESGLMPRDLRAATSADVPPPRRLRGPPAGQQADHRHDRWRTLILSIQLDDGSWINGRMVAPRPNAWLALRPLAATLLIYLIVLAAMIWMAARLARPLRDLTAAAQSFQGRGEAPHVAPSGPADLARAIDAFNAMGARVSAMLDEKDRMLGAIGHDLRTPIASLRIRAESVEPAEERERMIATLEEMAAMLDDALALARSGRAVEEVRTVELNALADAVVEEFRVLGHAVEMLPDARVTAWIQPQLLRRAIRNLVENGVKYAGATTVAVRDRGSQAAIEVSDRGPGIAAAELDRVQEPFYRIEPSRSRETGGTGLGLTLARAAAQAHGGTLELENRPEGGLIARILLPKEGGARAGRGADQT